MLQIDYPEEHLRAKFAGIFIIWSTFSVNLCCRREVGEEAPMEQTSKQKAARE
jgi:hypothetical protein